jgi:hypothetical protein
MKSDAPMPKESRTSRGGDREDEANQQQWRQDYNAG